MSDLQNTQDDVKAENRIFPPPAEFAASAAISGMDAYHALCKEAEQDYEGFWGRLAKENLTWHKPFESVLNESNVPFYQIGRAHV